MKLSLRKRWASQYPEAGGREASPPGPTLPCLPWVPSRCTLSFPSAPHSEPEATGESSAFAEVPSHGKRGDRGVLVVVDLGHRPMACA